MGENMQKQVNVVRGYNLTEAPSVHPKTSPDTPYKLPLTADNVRLAMQDRRYKNPVYREEGFVEMIAQAWRDLESKS